MSTSRDELTLRLVGADPARRLTVDEGTREQLWMQMMAGEGLSPRRRWRERARSWLRRRALIFPLIAALGGAAWGAQPAWCSPCNSQRHSPPSSSAARAVPPSQAVVSSTSPGPAADVGDPRPHPRT